MSFLPPGAPASAQGAAPSPPPMTKSKEKVASPEARADPAASGPGAGMTKQQRLALCIETWDAQTHMSRREWRVACERGVKNYPDAFR